MKHLVCLAVIIAANFSVFGEVMINKDILLNEQSKKDIEIGLRKTLPPHP